MRKLYLLSAIFVSVFLLQKNEIFGQTRKVTGTIFNVETGSPISGIKLTVKGTNITSVSNSKGEYLISVPDSLETVSFSEFNAMNIAEIKVISANNINIYLSHKDVFDLTLEELMNVEVNVASGKKALILQESPGIVTVVTEEEIKNSGARDMIDVLRLVPGIEFGLDGLGVAGLSMRGVWGHDGKVLLMIDGQEMNELSFTTNPFGNHYPVEQIKKIEIIRGAGSAIYGGFAELGVINIITRNGEDINGVSVSGAYGQMSETFARRNVNLSIGKKIKDFEFSLTGFAGQGNRSDRDYTDIYGSSYNMKDQAELNPMFFNAGMKYKDLQVRLMYDNYKLTMRDYFGANLLKAYKFSFDNTFAEIKYDLKIGNKFTITPKFNLKSGTPWKFIDPILPNEDPRFYLSNRSVTRIEGNLTATYDITEKINIIAGGDYYQDRAKDNLSIDKGGWGYWNEKMNINYNNVSGFLQSIIKTNYVNMTIGARVEKHSQFGTAFAPRIGLTKAFDKFHAKLLFSRAFRSPSIENIDYNAWLNPDYKPDVEPENTQVIEMEVGYKLSSNMFVVANIFNIKIDNTIVFFVEEAGKEGYKNLGQTGSQGFEFEYKIKYNWGYVNLNYSFYDTKGINKVFNYSVPGNENALLGAAQHKVTLNSSFNIYKGLSINPSMIFLGERYGYSSYDATIDDVVLTKYDPLLLANIFINYRDIFTKGLNFGIGVYDILGSNYDFIQAHNGWHAPLPGPSREFVFKLSYNFKFKK